jgi:fructosamine-3-kinase
MNTLAEAGAALIGGVLSRVEVLQAGGLSEIVHIRLADGREAVVKNGPAPRTEAAMLSAIAAAGVPAPAVLAASSEALVLEAVRADGGLDSAWASLGLAVKTLHAATGDRYGWREDYAFGPVAIENRWTDSWPTFWAERRLLVHLPHLPPGLARRVEKLAGDLPDLLAASPAPALLHGDLWSGNVLAAGTRISALIDPACYYGDREVDIAMLELFGRPGAAFYDTYGPLGPGYRERITIYRLWPALVHLRLFGNQYLPLAERLLSAAGA